MIFAPGSSKHAAMRLGEIVHRAQAGRLAGLAVKMRLKTVSFVRTARRNAARRASKAHRAKLTFDGMPPGPWQPHDVSRRSDVRAVGGVDVVAVVDQRCGNAWIAAVQDDDQFWAKANELTSDVVGLCSKNAKLSQNIR